MITRLRAWLLDLGELEPSATIARDLRAPRWLVAVALAVATFIIAAELLVPLKQRPDVELLLVVADASLALSFALWLFLRIHYDAGRLVDRLYTHRVNVLVAIFSLAFLAAATPRVAGAIVIARLLSAAFAALLSTRIGERVAGLARANPSRASAFSFAALIVAGTVLLSVPAATAANERAPLIDALFTMTSAVTITGLVLHDTGTYWSPFGQVVILLAMQTGAVGIMVLGAAFIVIVGGRLPQRQQVGLSEMLDVRPGETLRRLIAAVSATTLAAETLGVVLLYGLWLVGYLDLPERYDSYGGALWWSVFHSVAAFCNAGFALSPDSLSRFVGDPVVCTVFMLLITAGGLGFAVMSDLTSRRLPWLTRPRWAWHRLQLQTRVVLLMTLILDGVGFLAILFFEFDAALGPYDLGTKVNAALFQAVTLRTAGFNTIALSDLLLPTTILMLAWMFIGAAPGSTAGGVKTTTAVVVIFAVRAMLRGREDVEIYGRTLPRVIVYRSISIVLIAGVVLGVFLIALTATQDIRFDHLLFETVSAMGTVGASLGATTELDGVGRVLIAFLMYAGRLGPLTVALAVGERLRGRRYKYPEGRMAVG